MNARFIGEYNHTIDEKGRLIVPSKFRELLGDSFKIVKGLDRCLWVFTLDDWNEFLEKLTSLPVANKKARKLSRFFHTGAIPCETDKLGRVLITQPLREFAKLEKDVVFAGNGSRIEIWSKDEWIKASSFDDVDEIAEEMGEMGFEI